MLVTLSGAPGVGKKDLLRRFLRDEPAVTLLTLTTTRKFRMADLKGQYEYLTPRAFDLLGRHNMFITTSVIEGHVFGIRKDAVRKALDPKVRAMAIIAHDQIEALHVFALSLGAPASISSIFLRAPREEVLRKRLAEREEPPDMINARLEASRNWSYEAFQSPFYALKIPDEMDMETKHILVWTELHKTA